MCILTLWKGWITPLAHSPSCSHHDPNAMDIDAVSLPKLTPVEQAKCIKEGQYFRCRKTGHNAWNCHTSSPSQSLPSSPRCYDCLSFSSNTCISLLLTHPHLLFNSSSLFFWLILAYSWFIIILLSYSSCFTMTHLRWLMALPCTI